MINQSLLCQVFEWNWCEKFTAKVGHAVSSPSVENVKTIRRSLGGFLVHWLSVLLKMWKMWKISMAPSGLPLLIGYPFSRATYGMSKFCRKLCTPWISIGLKFEEQINACKKWCYFFGRKLAKNLCFEPFRWRHLGFLLFFNQKDKTF